MRDKIYFVIHKKSQNDHIMLYRKGEQAGGRWQTICVAPYLLCNYYLFNFSLFCILVMPALIHFYLWHSLARFVTGSATLNRVSLSLSVYIFTFNTVT